MLLPKATGLDDSTDSHTHTHTQGAVKPISMIRQCNIAFNYDNFVYRLPSIEKCPGSMAQCGPINCHSDTVMHPGKINGLSSITSIASSGCQRISCMRVYHTSDECASVKGVH